MKIIDTPKNRDKNKAALLLLEKANAETSHHEKLKIQQQVVLLFLDLATAMAYRFHYQRQDYADLKQIAFLGLIKAVQRFDVTKGTDVAAFAIPTIKGEIKQYLRDNSWLVKPPRKIQELSLAIKKVEDRLEKNFGRKVTFIEIADELSCDPKDVIYAYSCRNAKNAISLDSYDTTLNDAIVFNSSLRLQKNEYETVDDKLLLEKAMRVLSKEEKIVIKLRFQYDKTQKEIAALLGKSQMHVSRTLQRLLKLLKSQLDLSVLN